MVATKIEFQASSFLSTDPVGREGWLDAQVEDQVALALDTIRTALSRPDGLDPKTLTSLANRVKASATGVTLKERRAFLVAVGKRLQEEAGPSQEMKAKGLGGKHRRWESSDGQTINDVGTLLILMAKPR